MNRFKKIMGMVGFSTFGFLVIAMCFYSREISFLIVGWQPVQGGNIIRQAGKSDCGPAALMNVFKHYGIKASFKEIETIAGINAEGTSMLGLKRMAELKGLNARGWKYIWSDFLEARKPVIAFVRGNHYVVIEKANEDYVQMIDPAIGRLKMKSKKFKRIWQGETLQIERADRRHCPLA